MNNIYKYYILLSIFIKYIILLSICIFYKYLLTLLNFFYQKIDQIVSDKLA